MKNLFLTLMVLFLAFIIGCQESSITDPTQPFAEDQDAKVNTNDVSHNIIGLKYELADPRGGGTLQLTGQVSYNNTTLPSIADDGKVWVEVILGMSSQLSRNSGTEHPIWKIEDKSKDKVFFTNPATLTTAKKLSKTYSITNRDNVELCVTYIITLKKVRVAEVFFRTRDQ